MLEVDRILDDVEKLDLLLSGKFFAYIYETGDEKLANFAMKALQRFYNKNMLDFTVYRSAVFLEREIVSFCKKLLHGEDTYGTFTYGGTESIMLAALSARNSFWKRRGKGEVPEILSPYTIHPSFAKSAHYLGMNIKYFGVDERLKADVESLKESIDEKTALITISAPNWPFGTVDPVREIAEVAMDKGTLLHVDACLGGFILPFFEKLGEKVEQFDFRVEGVTSISADLHKYGYAPKGASVVLFRSADLKKESMFVDTQNPGYVFVNPTVLSSRSVGPLASAFAVVKYLGEEGYLRLSKQVLEARETILDGLKSLGFESVAPVESSILSLFNREIDLLSFTTAMREMGWHFHLQREVRRLSIPMNIHLTISPIHKNTARDFVSDAEKAVEKSKNEKREMKISIEKILGDLRLGKIDSSIAPLLVDAFDPEVAKELVKELVMNLYGD
ncbi:MAG: pyridoxal phosphate-dependent decarboxylase family protein [Archaeoglobaceae archaeon]